MAGKLRVQYPGVMNRGGRREPIVSGDEDRLLFMTNLGEASPRRRPPSCSDVKNRLVLSRGLKLAWVTLLLLNHSSEAVNAQGFTYITNTGTITITAYTGPGGTVRIPSSLDGYPVSCIGSNAFRNCSAVKSVAIPSTVTSIEDGAFQASGLTNITTGNAVTNIGQRAFCDCIELTDVAITSGLVCLSTSLFQGCRTLRHVSIPGSVTKIEDTAFSDCSQLAEIQIPDSVTNVGQSAFAWCTSLRNVTIPDSATRMGIQTFYNCRGLGNVVLGNSLTNIGDTTFAQCYSLTNVEIGASVTSIDASAFFECTGLRSVAVPASVTTIANAAFNGCSKLSAIYFLGNAPVLLGSDWFYGDDNPTVYYLPGAKDWGSTFGGLPTMLGTPVVPCALGLNNETLSIAKYTGFGGRSDIPSTIAGMPVTRIESSAFQSCSNLLSITIPGTVTNIADSAFAFCSMLAGIYFQGDSPALGADAFLNVLATVYYLPGTTGWSSTFGGLPTMLGTPDVPCALALNNGTLTVAKYTGFGGESIIPGTIAGLRVTSIERSAFQSRSNLLSITIPGTVATIGDSAFVSCTALTNITLSSGLFSIGDKAFCCCSSLPSATIPDTVTNIGRLAFYGCTNLAAIVVNAANAVYSSEGGALFDRSQNKLLQCPARTAGSFTVPAGVTNIEDYAFAFCSALTGLYFQSDIPSLGAGVFSNLTVTVFYLPWTSGWSSFVWGLPAATWNPQDLLQNGGFETGDFSDWALTGNSANSSGNIYNAVFSYLTGWTVTHSGRYGALLGDIRLATLSQTLSTVPGQHYLVSLWLENSVSGSTQRFNVNWNTNSAATNQLVTIANPPAFPWTNLQFLVAATGTNTTLEIQAENDPYYFGLDEIHVVPVTVPALTTSKIYTNGLSLSWATTPGIAYQVQYQTNLSLRTWINLGPAFVATGPSAILVDTNSTPLSQQRFYRFVLSAP